MRIRLPFFGPARQHMREQVTSRCPFTRSSSQSQHSPTKKNVNGHEEHKKRKQDSPASKLGKHPLKKISLRSSTRLLGFFFLSLSRLSSRSRSRSPSRFPTLIRLFFSSTLLS